MAPALDASDEQVRALATEILGRDSYAFFRSDPEPWLEALRWLTGWLDRLEQLRLDSPELYWLVVLGLLLATAGLLAHLAWTLGTAFRMRVPGEASDEPPAGPGALERSEAFARQGRFLEAARQLQLATLELLLRRRVIELSRSEPNRVLRRRLARSALPEAERGELLSLVDRLEFRWFRDRAEDADLYQSWRRLHGRVAALGGRS